MMAWSYHRVLFSVGQNRRVARIRNLQQVTFRCHQSLRGQHRESVETAYSSAQAQVDVERFRTRTVVSHASLQPDPRRQNKSRKVDRQREPVPA